MTWSVPTGYLVSGMQRALFGLGTSVLLCSACADQATSVSTCSTVSISVTSGTNPTFNWSADCQIEELLVYLPGPGAVVWATFSSNLTNSISPPVTYGVFPPGAALTANLQQPLVAGTRYQVTLLRTDAAGGQPTPIGVTSFVP